MELAGLSKGSDVGMREQEESRMTREPPAACLSICKMGVRGRGSGITDRGRDRTSRAPPRSELLRFRARLGHRVLLGGLLILPAPGLLIGNTNSTDLRRVIVGLNEWLRTVARREGSMRTDRSCHEEVSLPGTR